MRPVAMRCFLLTTILQTGQLALIETQENVWAAVGDQASLSCRLTEDKNVIEITWQKILAEGEKTLATYIKDFVSRSSPDLEEKMDFQYESLQSCSMVIRKVTEEDEACYRCLFYFYPKGVLVGRTCLKLHELPEPVRNPSNVSSSATDLDQDCGFNTRNDARLVKFAVGFLCAVIVTFFTIFCFRKAYQNRKHQRNKKPTEQTRNTQSEEHPIPEKNNDNNTSVLINRQSPKQQSPTTPTTPDIERCSPKGMKLHQKLTVKKSV